MNNNIVAIVGRPNVGKSTIFNRLCKRRSAIVDFEEGVTRDRKYANVEWTGREFTIVDTGGIIPDSDDSMNKLIKFQAELAIQEADVIMFVVDAHTGLTQTDIDIAKILYKSREKIILVANKVDNEKYDLDLYDFLSLGLGEAFPIAASSGRNTGNFLDELLKMLPQKNDKKIEQEDTINVAIVGRPNVGKSSIINKLVGKDNIIVSDIAGTTRDSIDSIINYKQKRIRFIDTAGLRKKGKIKYGIEYFSSMRTIDSVDEADIIIIVLDATQDFSNQDQKISSYAHRNFKNIIFVVNKWDLIEKDNKTYKEFQDKLFEVFSFLKFAPVIFTSALTNQRVHKILDIVLNVDDESKKRISTSDLNKFLEKITQKYPPSHSSGKFAKIYYCTQQNVKPPLFVFFCNNPKLISKNYRRYVHNQLRDYFKFEGSTIKLIFRGKDKNDSEFIEY